MPSSRSSPPPSGSPSTSRHPTSLLSVAAVAARAAAKVDAPAPPRPPTTTSTAPPSAAGPGAGARAATRRGACSGSAITSSAPMAVATRQSSRPGSPEATTNTPGRRGRCPAAQSSAAPASSTIRDDRDHCRCPGGDSGSSTAQSAAAAILRTSSRNSSPTTISTSDAALSTRSLCMHRACGGECWTERGSRRPVDGSGLCGKLSYGRTNPSASNGP